MKLFLWNYSLKGNYHVKPECCFSSFLLDCYWQHLTVKLLPASLEGFHSLAVRTMLFLNGFLLQSPLLLYPFLVTSDDSILLDLVSIHLASLMLKFSCIVPSTLLNVPKLESLLGLISKMSTDCYLYLDTKWEHQTLCIPNLIVSLSQSFSLPAPLLLSVPRSIMFPTAQTPKSYVILCPDPSIIPLHSISKVCWLYCCVSTQLITSLSKITWCFG